MDVPQGKFELRRFPDEQKSMLRAWDAADEYVLGHLHEAPDLGTQWLLVNDSFGALSVALSDHQPAMLSDSVLSHRAITENLRLNGLDPSSVSLLGSLADPPGRVDVLIVKIPKSLSLLEDQLHRLRPSLHEGTQIVGAGMARHIHKSTLELFEAIVGPTKTSLASKKARLIFVSVDPALNPGPTPYPTSFTLASGHKIMNHAGVFSRRRLDAGTRLLLGKLPTDLEADCVVDLGCGNGVVGLALALDNPDIELTMVDSSYLAVSSAEETFEASGAGSHTATFAVEHSMTGFADASVDLVVNNPPFHEDRSLADTVTWQMFNDAKRCLRPGGAMLVVGNRHLGYHVKLKRIFGNVDVVASNPKFVVLRSEAQTRNL